MNVGLRTSDVLLATLLAVAIPACQTGTSGGEQSSPLTGAPPLLQVKAPISVQQAELLASDRKDFDLLGVSVAISGDTALVGALGDDDRGTNAGAAYVFVRSGTSWTQQAKLTAADGGANDNFGGAVALSGDTAVVTAIFNDEASSDAGAAYVFVRSGTTWTQQAKLTAADASSNELLGISVALSGDTALVGTTNDNGRSGAAYVFVRGGTSWTQQAKLRGADTAAADQFGISVAVVGDTALVGAFGNDVLANSAGSAYVFVRSGTSWTQQAELLAADGQEGDQFGVSVAVSGDTALVGANLDDDHGTDSGSAYVFVRSGTSWTQQAKILAADGQEGDGFGISVALEADTAVLGASTDSDLGGASGSAYIFGRSGTSWTQQAKLNANDGASADFFGNSVALSGSTALIGAPDHDELGSSEGAAYAFVAASGNNNNGNACTTNADCASGFCTDGVCCDTACGGGDPTDCQACSVAAGAAVDGTCAPRAAGIVCREAAGACDVAERCTGSSAACPADALTVAGTVCRAAAGACDVAETCTGNSAACPADVLTVGGTVCRAAAGACDVAERCTGSSAACPSDALTAAGSVCRPAVGSCDAAESCTGSSVSCPANEHKPDLSLCRGGLLGLPGVCLAGVCVL